MKRSRIVENDETLAETIAVGLSPLREVVAAELRRHGADVICTRLRDVEDPMRLLNRWLPLGKLPDKFLQVSIEFVGYRALAKLMPVDSDEALSTFGDPVIEAVVSPQNAIGNQFFEKRIAHWPLEHALVFNLVPVTCQAPFAM